MMKLLKQKIFNEFLLKYIHLKVIKFDIIYKLQFIHDIIYISHTNIAITLTSYIYILQIYINFLLYKKLFKMNHPTIFIWILGSSYFTPCYYAFWEYVKVGTL